MPTEAVTPPLPGFLGAAFASGYERRCPEQTELHAVVREQLERSLFFLCSSSLRSNALFGSRIRLPPGLNPAGYPCVSSHGARCHPRPSIRHQHRCPLKSLRLRA